MVFLPVELADVYQENGYVMVMMIVVMRQMKQDVVSQPCWL